MINMLIFYCTDCKEMITAADSESTDQIADKLDEHITKCPLARFTFEGTSGVGRRRIGGLRSFLEGERPAGKIRLQRIGWMN